MLNRSFWSGRKVFVSGHTGFKGSWLSLWLEKLGADVLGYALEPPTAPSLFEQADIIKSTRTIFGDIRDFERLKAAISDFRPDVVLHMAAQSVVRAGYDDPVGTYSTNVMGTVHIFEALRQLGRSCVVVNVTSDKCYSNQEWVWGYRECEPMGGRDPYSNSKGCAELVTTAYRESFFPPATLASHGIALASARAGNAIGGGDWTSNQLIPDLMRSFLKGESCLIRSPHAIRPWQFVLEPLHGYLVLAERLSNDGARYATGWNFGPAEADAKPVSWIADELVKAWGQGASWTRDSAPHPREANFLKLDTSKARTELDWQPALPLPKALDWIAEWYRAFDGNADLRAITRLQIDRYERAIEGQERSSGSAVLQSSA
jgi:CDP-glucose 4,6-dehydratase